MNHDLEYYFQHVALPHLFEEQKEAFVAVALQEPNFLYDMLDHICKSQEEENPYSAADFKAAPIKFTKDILVLSISFPKPARAPLCYKQYIFFDPEFKHTKYFCIEKTFDDEEDLFPYVCSWEGETHCNHGQISMENEHADLIRCAEIFAKSAFGRDLKNLLREETGEE